MKVKRKELESMIKQVLQNSGKIGFTAKTIRRKINKEWGIETVPQQIGKVCGLSRRIERVSGRGKGKWRLVKVLEYDNDKLRKGIKNLVKDLGNDKDKEIELGEIKLSGVNISDDKLIIDVDINEDIKKLIKGSDINE